MTIRDDGKDGGTAGEPEIVVDAEAEVYSPDAHGGDEVPFASAIAMEPTPTPAPTPAPPPSHAQGHLPPPGYVPGVVPPPGQATPVAGHVNPPVPMAAQAGGVEPLVTPAIHGQGTTIPTGARWISLKHAGSGTWTICTIVSVVTCCCMCFPCGIWAFLCPCDEIRGYEVNGQVYDEHGRPLGHISRFR